MTHHPLHDPPMLAHYFSMSLHKLLAFLGILRILYLVHLQHAILHYAHVTVHIVGGFHRFLLKKLIRNVNASEHL